jgi:hypothetical protein
VFAAVTIEGRLVLFQHFMDGVGLFLPLLLIVLQRLIVTVR